MDKGAGCNFILCLLVIQVTRKQITLGTGPRIDLRSEEKLGHRVGLNEQLKYS